MRIFITAQALQKHEMETRFAAFMYDLIEHMLKLYMMPEHNSRNHWKQEIYAFANKVDKFKSSKKYPSKNQIFDWTYRKVDDILNDRSRMTLLVMNLCQSYGCDMPENLDEMLSTFDALCYDYFLWLSDKLSKDGIAFRSDVYSKLDELF